MNDDREQAAAWARSLLDRTDWVIVDTETTGLRSQDEIVQIAVVAHDGAVLLHTLVRPTQPIPLEATMIHGIRDENVENAPIFPEVYERLLDVTAGKTIIIFNAAFDVRMMRQSLSKHDLPFAGIDEDRVECAMLPYSAWVGELWPEGGYKWQRLSNGDHTALGDCLATLRLIRKMAAGRK